MLEHDIETVTDVDRLLADGLIALQPALTTLGSGVVLIGGLASAAWITARPVGFLVRATRDVDLGINQVALGIRGTHVVLRPTLLEHGFEPGYAGEPFRFSRPTASGDFVVDLLVAKGSSRHDPPMAEAGMPSLAAPGLRYALDRGPVPMRISLRGDEVTSISLSTITLDAAFVMKATLVADAVGLRPDKRATDTTDAVMLAAACAEDPSAMADLSAHRRRSEVKRAIAWLAEGLQDSRSLAARRVATVTGDANAALWAVEAAERFARAFDAAG